LFQVEVSVYKCFLHEVFRVLVVEAISPARLIEKRIIPADEYFKHRFIAADDLVNYFSVGILLNTFF